MERTISAIEMLARGDLSTISANASERTESLPVLGLQQGTAALAEARTVSRLPLAAESQRADPGGTAVQSERLGFPSQLSIESARFRESP